MSLQFRTSPPIDVRELSELHRPAFGSDETAVIMWPGRLNGTASRAWRGPHRLVHDRGRGSPGSGRPALFVGPGPTGDRAGDRFAVVRALRSAVQVPREVAGLRSVRGTGVDAGCQVGQIGVTSGTVGLDLGYGEPEERGIVDQGAVAVAGIQVEHPLFFEEEPPTGLMIDVVHNGRQ